MKDFLTYTARWEQDMVLSLKDRYSSRSAQVSTVGQDE